MRYALAIVGYHYHSTVATPMMASRRYLFTSRRVFNAYDIYHPSDDRSLGRERASHVQFFPMSARLGFRILPIAKPASRLHWHYVTMIAAADRYGTRLRILLYYDVLHRDCSCSSGRTVWPRFWGGHFRRSLIKTFTIRIAAGLRLMISPIVGIPPERSTADGVRAAASVHYLQCVMMANHHVTRTPEQLSRKR